MSSKNNKKAKNYQLTKLLTLDLPVNEYEIVSPFLYNDPQFLEGRQPDKLPHDRGREFTLKDNAEAAKGKPTGAGIVFISIFTVLCLLLVPMTWVRGSILALTWLTMLTGYLDDRSITSWGEYLKGALDLILSVAAAFVLYYGLKQSSPDGIVKFWLPFTPNLITVHPVVYIILCTVMIWASINTTNCTDGVDGLSATLVLIALLTLGAVFYFVLGHVDISAYLLLPHFPV